jgi:hypothetical protein
LIVGGCNAGEADQIMADQRGRESAEAARQAALVNHQRSESYVADAKWKEKVAVGRRPKNYQDLVQRNLRDTAIDPASMKFEFTSNPAPGLSCGTVNGRNTYGGYTGKHVFAAYFDPSGLLQDMREMSPNDVHLHEKRQGHDIREAGMSLFRMCGWSTD